VRHPFFDVPVPTVIGHRGAAGELPENTLASFERALARGAAILESDVHISRDGVLVLIHDDVLERTTNGSGRVADHTLAELRALDAGDRFSPASDGRFPYRNRGFRIPTLEEALKTFDAARFNLELKERRDDLIETTLALLRATGREETVLLAAADDALMVDLRARVRASGARVALGASAGDVLAFVRSALDGARPPPGPMALQVPPGFGTTPLVTSEFVAHAHAHGLVVHVWTVNEPAEMDRLLDLGIDGIMSDFPGRVTEVVTARRDRG
jgi:glycerophosphoryl diester phosphodiesterase